MPVYEFECKAGHRTAELFPVSSCPKTVKCRCGSTAKITVSKLGSFAVAGTTGNTKDDDDEVRDARRKHREMCEWGEAVGTINCKPNSAPTKDAQVTSEGVKEKKKALAQGKKIPEAYRQIAPEDHYVKS